MRGALSPGYNLLGKYQIEKVIGGGGFGLTYLGLDLRSMRRVCIKELFIHKNSVRHDNDSVSVAPEDADREFFMERFLREAQSLASFHHPHVVRVEDFFQTNGTAYYVMEFVEGMTLADHVKQNGTLDLGQFRHIFRQLIDAMEEVHDQNLLHRDIKPSNVMLEPGLRVKLIDFGAAKDPKVQAKSGHTVVITDGFAPLEQYSAGGDIGAHSDIYSLGATMLFALTGQRPQPATSRDDGDAEMVGQPQPLVDLLSYFMQTDASERPRSMASAKAEFEQSLSTAMQAAVEQREEVNEEGHDLPIAGSQVEVEGKDEVVALGRGMNAAGKLAIVGLAIQIVSWVCYWFGLVFVVLAIEESFGSEFEEALGVVWVGFFLLAVGLTVIGLICSSLGFLRWVHRLHKVAHVLNVGRWPIGQAQWSWFVPVLGLFRPVQILRNCAQVVSDEHEMVKRRTTIGWWWGLFLLIGLLGTWVPHDDFDFLPLHLIIAGLLSEFSGDWAPLVVLICETVVIGVMIVAAGLAIRLIKAFNRDVQGLGANVAIGRD